MASFNDCLTADGQKVFALMARGCKVTFTKVVLGDGIKKDSVSEVDIQKVINPVITLNIDSVTKSADNKVTIRCLFSNTQARPFYMREKGVYATIDGTEEFLVFYANNGALAEYIDVAKTQLIEKVIRTVIMFSESDNINITLSNSAYAPPTINTNATNIQEFISGTTSTGSPVEGSPASGGSDMDVGSEVIITNGDGEKEVYIYVGGDQFDMDNYLQVYGTRAMVVMHEYIPISQRVKGSLYLQLGKTRRLIVKIFRKFYNRLPEETDTEDTLLFKQTDTKTTNVDDGNKYRILCKNLSILQQGDSSERLEGKIYFIADPKE